MGAGDAGDKLINVARGLRATQQIALDLGATGLADCRELRVGLDTFRGRLHVEVACHGYNGLDDFLGARTRDDVLDEGAVDLDLVEGEAGR